MCICYLYFYTYIKCILNIYIHTHTRSVQKVSIHVILKIETFIEEDKRYKKHCTEDNDASVPFKVGTLRLHTVLPITISCPVVYFESHWKSESSSLSKVILVLGKAGCQIWALVGLNHLGGLMFHQKTLHQTWCMSRHIMVMKLPITSCP